jgi:hypothetical protein
MLQTSGMTSTFWLSSRETAERAYSELDSVGYGLGQVVKAPSGLGLWLTVTHEPDDLVKLMNVITRVDPSAVKE